MKTNTHTALVVDVQRDFTTRVLLKACAGVAAKTIEAAIAEMRAAGVDLVP